MKPVNQKAWLLILPVLLCVAFSAILPLMTVVNYSVQDIISPERRVFVGTEWFAAVMRDQDLHDALGRQMIFSLAVLAFGKYWPRFSRQAPSRLPRDEVATMR
jgi:glycerol transport system permease protein